MIIELFERVGFYSFGFYMFWFICCLTVPYSLRIVDVMLGVFTMGNPKVGYLNFGFNFLSAGWRVFLMILFSLVFSDQFMLMCGVGPFSNFANVFIFFLSVLFFYFFKFLSVFSSFPLITFGIDWFLVYLLGLFRFWSIYLVSVLGNVRKILSVGWLSLLGCVENLFLLRFFFRVDVFFFFYFILAILIVGV